MPPTERRERWARVLGAIFAPHPLSVCFCEIHHAPFFPRALAPTQPPDSIKQTHNEHSKYDGDALWLPNTTRPEWLDGTLREWQEESWGWLGSTTHPSSITAPHAFIQPPLKPLPQQRPKYTTAGDRGFDPLGLSRPSDFVQIGVDENDINAPKNFKGDVEGKAATVADVVSETSLSPYSEVFGLQRFRETELIHGRWAMLGVLGALVAEGVTGQSWIDAAKAELAGAPAYAGLELPWSINTAAVLNSLLMGGVEIFRNSELDPERRCYPGGAFDPLNFADESNPQRAFQLKEAELKHGRLAMVAALGFAVQAGFAGEGALGSLAKFGASF
jgi:light-harvesting complex II chlorophyll a/b binding protein 4